MLFFLQHNYIFIYLFLFLQQDGVTLDYIRVQLEECTVEHSQTCLGQPVFTMETALGLQNIIMSCPVCEFMFIVI